jgi:dihydroorotase
MGKKGEGECVDFASMKNDVIAFRMTAAGVQTEALMRDAMEKCAALDCIISAHCEVNELLHGGYIHDGEYCKAHNHKGICSESEWAQIERDCRLAEETGCRYHVCHISTKESVEIIRAAKARGVKVTCETAPHYLTLCDDDLQEDGRFKMNPPCALRRTGRR